MYLVPVPLQTALGWVTIQGVDVDAAGYKYCKIPEAEKRGLQCMRLGQKKLQTMSLGNGLIFFENVILGKGWDLLENTRKMALRI